MTYLVGSSLALNSPQKLFTMIVAKYDEVCEVDWTYVQATPRISKRDITCCRTAFGFFWDLNA